MQPILLFLPILRKQLDALSLGFGLLMFFGGIVLMFQHLRQWRRIEISGVTGRQRTFEWHKFRRRTLVGALVAACGAIATSLSAAVHPIMYVSLVTILVLFLILILVLATIDLTAIGLFQITHRDPEKQRAELEEIVRRQKQRASHGKAAEDSQEENEERASRG